MFHFVPGVPRVKMERFARVDTQTCASPYIKLQLHVVILKSEIEHPTSEITPSPFYNALSLLPQIPALFFQNQIFHTRLPPGSARADKHK